MVTVLELLQERRAVSMLVSRASMAKPGELESRTIDLEMNSTLKISDGAEVTLLDLRNDKARIGIQAPMEYWVHRMEVYEAIRDFGKDGADPGGGTAGSPVPRPSAPTPPSLDVRLDEPLAGDGDCG